MQPRVIPVLLLDGHALYKTQQFRRPRYLGDPVNTVRIFNEKGCDELMILDIGATASGRGPNFDYIREIASECFMPICFGGGIRTLQDCERLFNLGIEKVAVNTAAALDPAFVAAASRSFGAQSIVVIADYRRTWLGGAKVYTVRGRTATRWNLVEYAKRAEELGAGELVVQSIDRDGTGRGYDLATIHQVASAVSIPVVACGGAGGVSDLVAAMHVAHAAAAGSMFVFQGPHRAVLISYPDRGTMKALIDRHLKNQKP